MIVFRTIMLTHNLIIVNLYFPPYFLVFIMIYDFKIVSPSSSESDVTFKEGNEIFKMKLSSILHIIEAYTQSDFVPEQQCLFKIRVAVACGCM